MHASTMLHAASVPAGGALASAPSKRAPREAANDVARPGAPNVHPRSALRLTPDEQRRELRRAEVRAWLARLFAPVLGLILFGLLWQLIAQTSGQLPTPAKVWHAAVAI